MNKGTRSKQQLYLRILLRSVVEIDFFKKYFLKNPPKMENTPEHDEGLTVITKKDTYSPDLSPVLEVIGVLQEPKKDSSVEESSTEESSTEESSEDEKDTSDVFSLDEGEPKNIKKHKYCTYNSETGYIAFHKLGYEVDIFKLVMFIFCILIFVALDVYIFRPDNYLKKFRFEF